MEKVKINVKKGNLDINGNRKYIYNFIGGHNGENLNHEFKLYGRVTKNGLFSQIEPIVLNKSLKSFGKWLELPVGQDMGKAQKAIDKCNNKNGCNVYCSISNQKECRLLKEHSQCIDRLAIVQEFLKDDVEIINE